MICKKCGKESAVDGKFCPFCGFRQTAPLNRRTRQVGNGSGTAYKRGNSWTIKVITGWKTDSDGVKRPVTKSKGGFKSRKDAMLYAGVLLNDPAHKKKETFGEIMEKWKKKYEPRIAENSMRCYVNSYKHFSSIKDIRVDLINANMLQECIDNCQAGKRTKISMKTVANFIMRYALDDDQIAKNPAENLYTGNDPTNQRPPITEAELNIIRDHLDEDYADYVYALCYLGFRPTEFLSLKKTDFHEEDGIKYLVGGSKTKAGKNRTVTIPPLIENIIEKRLAVEGTDLLFPKYDKSTNGKYTGTLSKMSADYFRTSVFDPLMDKLGIEHRMPYSARHTYANKIKRVYGADKDKASLMGHSKYETTVNQYQSTELDEKKNITDQLK